jgi:hypothetical protein
MRNKITWISNEEVISALFTGVTDIKMKEKWSMNDEMTSMVKLRYQIFTSSSSRGRSR